MVAFFPLFRAVASAHLIQRPLRTALTVLGVALGVAASVAIKTANVDVLRSFEQAVETVAGTATLEVSGGEVGLDEDVIRALRSVPGVRSASPVIDRGAAIAHGPHRGEAVSVLGIDLLSDGESRGFRVRGRDAASPRESPPSLEALLADDAVFLGQALADEWRLSVGDSFPVMAGNAARTLRVAGLVDGGRPSVWDRLALMDIAAAQIVFDAVGRLDRIDLTTDEGAPVEEVRKAVESILSPPLTVRRPAQRSRQVEDMIGAFQLNLAVLSWVGLVVGMFLIYNTVAFSVAQRRREIGIFRAVGMSEWLVVRLFLAEALVFGVAGGLLGSLGGLMLAHTLVSLISRTISDLYVPVATVLSNGGRWATMVLLGIAVGSVVSVAGALGPSLDAGRTVPVRALAPGDYEAARRLRVGFLAWVGLALCGVAGLFALGGPVAGLPLFGYAATLCLLAGLSCLAPFCLTWGARVGRRARAADAAGVQGVMRDIAIEHAVRNPGRNGVTVSALMVGLSIMIGVVIMVRSFRHTVELWIEDTVIADLVVAPSSWLSGTDPGSVGRWLPPSWLPVLASTPGVAAVDAYRDVRLDVDGRQVSLVARDLSLHARRSRYLVRAGDSTAHLLRAADVGGVLVSEVLADRLGVREGRSVNIETPEGRRSFPVIAVFYDYATDGGKLVMDRSLYRSLWHDDRVTVYSLYLEPEADLDEVRRALGARLASADPGAMPPAMISNRELRKEILDIFDRTFALTYALEAIAVVIAMLGIVNTLVTSVLERRREFGTLRAIGGSAGQIRRLVLWEATYLGVVGILLGLAGGGLLSLLLIKVINKQSFGWTIQMTIPADALLEAVVLAAAATLIAGYVPARWAGRQPIVEGLREE